VGHDEREEVNLLPANRFGVAGRGKNLGWPDCEGTWELRDDEGDADNRCEQHTLPTFDYGHTWPKCAVVGGHVHRGPDARNWRGLYVAADVCGWFFVLGQSGNLRWSTDLGMSVASLGQDSAGRLFAADVTSGTIHRVLLRGGRP